MAPSTWPAMMPFDPESGEFPPALEALFARPPATVPAVLVVVGAAARRSGWAGRAAIAVATAWSERRPAITLADLTLSPSELASLLEVPEGEGLAEVFEFGISLGRAARSVPGKRFRFMSSGLYVPDTGALFEHPRWERVVAQHAEEQATLLVYAPADATGLESLARRVGKALILAAAHEVDRIAGGLPSNCSVLAVLRSPGTGGPVGSEDSAGAVLQRTQVAEGEVLPVDPVAGEPATEEERLTEPTFVQRAKPKKRRRVSPALWLLLIIAVAVGTWFGAERFLGLGKIDTASAADAVQRAAGDARISEAVPEPIEAPMPYSITVEAHPEFQVAVERVKMLRDADPEIAFFVAPIVVNDVIYYRILSGLAADTAAANALMRRLVERGHKSEVDAWAIRPTAWTFQVGEFETAEAAEARADSLLDLGVPTYSVEVPYSSGPSRFRLYAGAYEGPVQGAVMAELLEKAGVEAQLVRRMGRPVE